MKNTLKIIPLGGMGQVTQNMFVYEYNDELLIVDCGIGFPDTHMPGVDILIPDTSYVLKRLDEGAKIVGMILSHGHDDHIGATPYIMPTLPEFPIFASPLTAGFAEQRMLDANVTRPITTISNLKPFTIGTHFSAYLIPVTHSVPDTRHVVIDTPEGIVYHGSDFKLDKAPVGGELTDMRSIEALKDKKVLLMLLDCLRIEYSDWVESESKVGPAIEEVMEETDGKLVMTLMSSHIHRIQQTINAAEKYDRKVVFIGRSVEQNVEVALRLGTLTIPEGMKIDKKHIDQVADKNLCVIVAGSQGQEGSSMVRAIYGEHRILQIKPDDTVVFSADAIPGNEVTFYGAIDELSRNNVHVVYPAIKRSLHQSGHASWPEQKTMIEAVKPQYLMPVGGADRHRVLFYHKVSDELGYNEKNTLLPESGEVLGFSKRSWSVVDQISIRPQIIDGLGIGDVGPTVLSDRKALGQAGIVVLVMPRFSGEFDLKNMQVISKGFVFMKDAEEVIQFIKTQAAAAVDSGEYKTDEQLMRLIEKRLARKLYKVIRREPLIVPVVLDL